MKWLLITTVGKNAGCDMVAVGVRRLIREVDKSATFSIVDLEDEKTWAPQPFDKAVWCSGVLFRSTAKASTYQSKWWTDLLFGWPSAVKNNFLVLNAASEEGADASNVRSLASAVIQIQGRSFKAIASDGICSDRNSPLLVSPAYFAVRDYASGHALKLCNLMPFGHEMPSLAKRESSLWIDQRLEKVAEILLDAGFKYVAHSQDGEHDSGIFGEHLGFSGRIIHGDADRLLKFYGNCGMYFGNRLSGGIATAGNKGSAIVCSYTSRMSSSTYAGCMPVTPWTINLEELKQWAGGDPEPAASGKRDGDYRTYIDILTKFAAA